MRIKAATYRILLCSLFVCQTLLSYSQEIKSREVDRNYWRKLKRGLKYDESPKNDSYNRNWSNKYDPDKKNNRRDGKGGYGEYTKRQHQGGHGGNRQGNSGNGGNIDQRKLPQEEYESPSPSITIHPYGGGGFGALGWILLAVLLGVLIFIIYKMIADNTKRRDKKIKLPLEEESEATVDHVELPKSELELRLETALRDGNYREAVRIWFIFIIKGLKEKGWISWERKKTNTSYLYEMRSRPEYGLFSNSVTLFELIWYGKQDISKEDYSRLEPLFRKMIAEVEKK